MSTRGEGGAIQIAGLPAGQLGAWKIVPEGAGTTMVAVFTASKCKIPLYFVSQGVGAIAVVRPAVPNHPRARLCMRGRVRSITAERIVLIDLEDQTP